MTIIKALLQLSVAIATLLWEVFLIACIFGTAAVLVWIVKDVLR